MYENNIMCGNYMVMMMMITTTICIHMLLNCCDYDVVNTCCQLIVHPYTTWVQLF